MVLLDSNNSVPLAVNDSSSKSEALVSWRQGLWFLDTGAEHLLIDPLVTASRYSVLKLLSCTTEHAEEAFPMCQLFCNICFLNLNVQHDQSASNIDA